MKWIRLGIRIIKWLVGGTVVLAILVFLMLQIPGVQRYASQRTLAVLGERFGGAIEVKDIRLTWLNRLKINDLVVFDARRDTMMHIGHLHVRFNPASLWRNEVVIHGLSLRETGVHVYRENEDEGFNYEALLNLFASEQTTSDTSKTPWTFTPGMLRFDRLHFEQRDAVTGNDISGSLASGLIDIRRLDLENRHLAIRKVELVQPVLQTKRYAAPGISAKDSTSTASDSSASQPWQADVQRIQLLNGRVVRSDERKPELAHDLFDANHINVGAIHLDLTDMTASSDTLTARLQLKLQESCGLDLQELSGDFIMTQNGIGLSRMNLRTAETLVRDEFMMSFLDWSSFNRFEEEVYMRANLSASSVHLADLAYFVPYFKGRNESVLIKGDIDGTISSLSAHRLAVQYGSETEFRGQFSLSGLPDVATTFIDFQVDTLRSSRDEFNRLLPFANLPQQVRKLGTVAFKGNFVGLPSSFVAFGSLATALGQFDSDMMINAGADEIPSYSGSLRTSAFRLGYWLDAEMLNEVAFDAHVDGQGLRWGRLEANLSGTVDYIDANGYRYTNISSDGKLKDKFFSGKIEIDDPNLNLAFDGTMDLEESRPLFDLSADITKANLDELNLSTTDLELSSKMKLNFSGLDPDDITGTFDITETKIVTNGHRQQIGKIFLHARDLPSGRQVELKSDAADVTLSGKFNSTQLVGSIEEVVAAYYYNRVFEVDTLVEPQQLNLFIHVKEELDFLNFALPGLSGWRGTRVDAVFNSQKKSLNLRARVPDATYAKTSAQDLEIQVATQQGKLAYFLKSSTIALPDGTVLNGSIAQGHAAQDTLQYNLRTSSDKHHLFAGIGGILTGQSDTITVELDSAKVMYADELWRLASGNGNMQFSQNAMQITTHRFEGSRGNIQVTGDQRSIDVELDGLELAWLSPLLGDQLQSLTGVTNGSVTLDHILDNKIIALADIRVEQMTFNEEQLGDFFITGGYDFAQDSLRLRAIMGGLDSMIVLDGYYQARKTKSPIHFDLIVQEASMELLEPFIVGLASDLDGRISGTVALGGTPERITMHGGMSIVEAKAKFDYLNTSYTFDEIKLEITEQSISIAETNIVNNGVKAELGGEISFFEFDNFAMEDFYIRSDPGFLLMNIPETGNDGFYGKAYGEAIVLINGPFNDLKIDINARTDKGTKISMPIEYDSEFSEYDFIQIVNKAISAPRPLRATTSSGVDLNIELDVTTDALLEIIFDAQAGDLMRARGSGNITVKVNPAGDVSIFGQYEIEKEGLYAFRMPGLTIRRDFEILPGSRIVFSGDPYDAEMDVKAAVEVRAKPYDLVQHLSQTMTEDERRSLQKEQDVQLVMHLTGPLSAPDDLRFDIKPTDESRFGGIFEQRLQELRSDPNAMNKQAFGLVVFKRFIPENLNDAGSGGTVIAGTAGSLGDFVSGQLELYFNEWLNKYNFNLDFGVNQYDLSDAGSATRRTELEFELQKQVNRWNFTVGGNLDIGASESGGNNLAADFGVEYSITEDGQIRLKFFRESDYDIIVNGNRSKTGVAVFYSREFDGWKDWLKRRPKP